jgi:hypothetical protein
MAHDALGAHSPATSSASPRSRRGAPRPGRARVRGDVRRRRSPPAGDGRGAAVPSADVGRRRKLPALPRVVGPLGGTRWGCAPARVGGASGLLGRPRDGVDRRGRRPLRGDRLSALSRRALPRRAPADPVGWSLMERPHRWLSIAIALLGASLTACGDDEDGEQLVCVPNSQEACYEGPAETNGVGACREGLQSCSARGDAQTGCLGQITPDAEDCLTPSDDDCDGEINEGLRVHARRERGVLQRAVRVGRGRALPHRHAHVRGGRRELRPLRGRGRPLASKTARLPRTTTATARPMRPTPAPAAQGSPSPAMGGRRHAGRRDLRGRRAHLRRRRPRVRAV